MTVLCPRCGAVFSPSLFEAGIPFRCDCGAMVDGTCRVSARVGGDSRGTPVLFVHTPEEPGPEVTERLTKAARQALLTEEQNIGELRSITDRITYLIVATDYPTSDIELETAKARRRCEELFPDRVYLFDMIYGSRFRRLLEQFRPE